MPGGRSRGDDVEGIAIIEGIIAIIVFFATMLLKSSRQLKVYGILLPSRKLGALYRQHYHVRRMVVVAGAGGSE